MFGLKIPTVWLNSAFMLPVSQAEHLIKTHLGLNAKNQDGHIRTEGTSFSLCKGTLNLEWYHDFHTWGCTSFYTILDHHSYPWPSYPHPLACTHTHTYTHMVGCTVETKTLDILKKYKSKSFNINHFFNNYLLNIYIYWALPFWYLIF